MQQQQDAKLPEPEGAERPQLQLQGGCRGWGAAQSPSKARNVNTALQQPRACKRTMSGEAIGCERHARDRGVWR